MAFKLGKIGNFRASLMFRNRLGTAGSLTKKSFSSFYLDTDSNKFNFGYVNSNSRHQSRRFSNNSPGQSSEAQATNILAELDDLSQYGFNNSKIVDGKFNASKHGEQLLSSFIKYMKDGNLPNDDFIIRLLDFQISENKKLPNVMKIENKLINDKDNSSDTIVICGDTHGQFFDFCRIFEVAGLPSPTNRFLFNGDMVDRGANATEILLTLLLAKTIYPNSVYIHQGNHESPGMISSYGFQTEVYFKFKPRFKEVIHKFLQLFLSFPVASVLNNKFFIVHGGIGERTYRMTIEDMNKLDRSQGENHKSFYPFLEMLWCDPGEREGLHKSPRGFSNLFGPDITESFLSENNLEMIIRSHEVKDQGYELAHNNKCLTVFSAPKYCGSMTNLGSFVKVRGGDSALEIVCFHEEKLTRSFSQIPITVKYLF